MQLLAHKKVLIIIENTKKTTLIRDNFRKNMPYTFACIARIPMSHYNQKIFPLNGMLGCSVFSPWTVSFFEFLLSFFFQGWFHLSYCHFKKNYFFFSYEVWRYQIYWFLVFKLKLKNIELNFYLIFLILVLMYYFEQTTLIIRHFYMRL